MITSTALNPHPKGPAAARKAQGYDTDHDRLAEAERNLREVKHVLSFVPGDVWIKAIEDAKVQDGRVAHLERGIEFYRALEAARADNVTHLPDALRAVMEWEAEESRRNN